MSQKPPPSDFFGDLANQIEALSSRIVGTIRSILAAFANLMWEIYSAIEGSVVSTLSGIIILIWSARLLAILMAGGLILVYLHLWLASVIYFSILSLIIWRAYATRKASHQLSASTGQSEGRTLLETLLQWLVRVILLATSIAALVFVFGKRPGLFDRWSKGNMAALEVPTPAPSSGTKVPSSSTRTRQGSEQASGNEQATPIPPPTQHTAPPPPTTPSAKPEAPDQRPQPAAAQTTLPPAPSTSAARDCSNAIICEAFEQSLPSKTWFTHGNSVEIVDGALAISTTKTDAGGQATVIFTLPSSGARIDRRVKLRAGNDHASPRLTLYYRDEAGKERQVFSIFYGKMLYSDATYGPVIGTFLAPGDANPHILKSKPATVAGPPVVWNEWYRESIKYNSITGKLVYSRENAQDTSTSVPAIAAGTTVYLRMDAWGWWTGHAQLVDHLLVFPLQ